MELENAKGVSSSFAAAEDEERGDCFIARLNSPHHSLCGGSKGKEREMEDHEKKERTKQGEERRGD